MIARDVVVAAGLAAARFAVARLAAALSVVAVFAGACGEPPPLPPQDPSAGVTTAPAPHTGPLAITALNVDRRDVAKVHVDYVVIGTSWADGSSSVNRALLAMGENETWTRVAIGEQDITPACRFTIRCEDDEHHRMATASPTLLSGSCLDVRECPLTNGIGSLGYTVRVHDGELSIVSLHDLIGWEISASWTAACKRVLANDESLAHDADLLAECMHAPEGKLGPYSLVRDDDYKPRRFFWLTNDALVLRFKLNEVRMPWKDLKGVVDDAWIREAEKLQPLLEGAKATSPNARPR